MKAIKNTNTYSNKNQQFVPKHHISYSYKYNLVISAIITLVSSWSHLVKCKLPTLDRKG